MSATTTTTTAPALVQVERVSKEYGPLPRWLRLFTKSALTEPLVALDEVDLSVTAGTICAVVGPNGAGKSTLFRILMGLTTPTTGSARILDHDVVDCSTELRRSLGFMASDDKSLLLRLSCAENLAFHGRLRGYRGMTLERRVGEVLEEVGLGGSARRAAYALSAGMRARLQIARSILHRPAVLILDEPTGTLDPVAAYDVLELVRRVTAENSLAVLLSSHRLEEIDALDETVLLLDRGRRIFHGPLSVLRSVTRSTELILEFGTVEGAAEAGRRLRDGAGIERVDHHDRSIEVAASTTAGGVLELLGPSAGDILHVVERSGATRELLRRAYTGPASAANGSAVDA